MHDKKKIKKINAFTLILHMRLILVSQTSYIDFKNLLLTNNSYKKITHLFLSQ